MIQVDDLKKPKQATRIKKIGLKQIENTLLMTFFFKSSFNNNRYLH